MWWMIIFLPVDNPLCCLVYTKACKHDYLRKVPWRMNKFSLNILRLSFASIDYSFGQNMYDADKLRL